MFWKAVRLCYKCGTTDKRQRNTLIKAIANACCFVTDHNDFFYFAIKIFVKEKKFYAPSAIRYGWGFRALDGAVTNGRDVKCISRRFPPLLAPLLQPIVRLLYIKGITTSWLDNVACRLDNPSRPCSSAEQMLKEKKAVGWERGEIAFLVL